MFAGFYPSTDCIPPKEQLGPTPDVHDIKAMNAYNSESKAFNILAESFNGCIKSYVARAQTDIDRITGAARDAVTQTKVL